jgi:hypothetical protein
MQNQERRMTSEAQITANRRNSQLSTGPRTDAGKDIARRNALRHGLAARTLVVAPWEDAAEFAAFAADLRADLAPAGACEEALAQRIVLCAWRLERICRIEADLLMGEGALLAKAACVASPPVGAWPAEMAALGRTEGMLDRAMERAMKLLRERQKLRLSDALPEALAESAERSQFAEAEIAERSQSDGASEAEVAARCGFDEEVAADLAERSQFDEADDEEEEEELLSPQEILARREAERLERARIINESCRPKARAS